MANTLCHVVALYALIFIWILAAKARTISDNSNNLITDVFPPRMKEKNIFFSSDEFVPNLEFERAYRSPKKLMRPRATRVGDNMELFTARGYGKRSSGGCRNCKKEMSLISARRFGKRDPEKMENLLCMITNCKNDKNMLAIEDDLSKMMERRDKEIPQENSLDDD